MERDYDLFEVQPDGAPIWREPVPGHGNAIQKSMNYQSERKTRFA
jgi:hypothetical protein